MFEIIVVKPQREEDKLMEHEEARRKQTHSDIATLIGPMIALDPMKFYYRKSMLRRKTELGFVATVTTGGRVKFVPAV